MMLNMLENICAVRGRPAKEQFHKDIFDGKQF
jgi:hypothetical protein